MKKHLILFVLLLFGWVHESTASHLMGGEITWDCLKTGPNTGQYIFTVKLYRDCNGIPGPPNLTLTTNAPGGAINCPLITQTDISPKGPGCPTCASPGGYANAVEEFVYRSGPVNLGGVPPVGGYYFYYNDCCRNGLITNLASTNDFTLRAFMYPYNATNTNPCFDSSPQFAEKPQLGTCTRNQTSYNHNAVDVELDSLVYSWGYPLENGFPGTNIPFAATYSFNSPLPGPALNPLNVAAVMNPSTGVVTFTSYTPGAFVTVTKVTAYKCGIKVAEIFREIQIALLNNCIIAQPPAVPATVYNTPPDVQDLFGNPLSVIIDTVYAGDTVEIDLIAFDFEALPASAGGGPQSLSLNATGSQFGTNFTNSSAGCPFPPCATLSPPLIDTVPPINTLFFPLTLQTKFKWITDCNHLPRNLGCVILSSTYNFVLKTYDNFCPSPAVNFNTLTIVVLAPPAVKGARMKCADVLPNGNVNLTFLPPIDTGKADTNQFFKAFYVFRSTTGTAGPYTLLDSLKGFRITDYDTVLTYSDLTANANLGPVSYYLTTRSGCDLTQRLVSDTISTIFLQVNQVGFDASLTWTPLQTPLGASTTRKYYIWREQPPAGSGNWNLIDSTTNLSYLDPVFVCDDSINYRIQVVDTSAANCVSRSNIDGSRLQSAIPNITSPSLRSTEVLANGDVALCWVGSIDTASYFSNYTIYHSTTKAGPFVSIGTVSVYAANAFTHVGANANNQINYYYVTLSAGCDASSVSETSIQTSDTLASMLLLLNNSTIGFADLNWNAIRKPLPVTSTGSYIINRRIAPGAWAVIGNTVDTFYRDVVILCDTAIQYRVDIGDASACFSKSSMDTGQFTSLGDIIANPELRCLAVQANGDVQVSWIAPPDPNNFFAAVQIYHSAAPGGPFALVGSVTNYATTSWTHVGANANTAIQYYRLVSLSGCDGLQTLGTTSATLATMLLSVSNATLGSANLSWNAMITPALGSAPGPYRVMRRSTGIGAYVQIGTTAALTYSDPITTCNIPYEYRIELDDTAPCTSISSADNDVFTYVGNIIPNPTLRCVDVVPNGNVQLFWENPSPASFVNFNEYEIWRNSGAGFVLVDSVGNSATNTYTDIIANGNAQAYSYYLVTQSGCTGQVTTGTTSNTMSSIFLTTAGVIGQANLNWSALCTPLLPSAVGGQYNVFSNYNALATLQGIGNTATLLFNHPINDCDTVINHQVTVVDNIGCTSRSNIASNTYTYIGNIVNNPDLRCVNVLANGQIQLSWITPTGSSGEFNEFEIFRNSGAGFVLYDSVSNFAQTSWTDAFANGNAQSYSYYMRSQSGCTGQVDNGSTSATLSSIYLTTVPALGSATLNWTALPLLASSSQYDVFSSYNATGTLNSLGTTIALTYNEVISNCDTTLRHRITVTDNSGCVSNSNVDTNIFTYIGNVVNNPDLRCVSVLPSGQIELTWILPTGSNVNFNEYEIYRDNGTGFVLYDSVGTFAQTTWIDVNANGNTQSYGYYVRSQSGCSGQIDNGATSVTLRSIYLSTTPTLGQANLNWSALSTPLPATVTSGQYDVWSSYNAGGVLTIFGDTNLLVYAQTINDCDTNLNHQISAADNSGCISRSNIANNNFTYIGNVIDHPELRCASVNPNGDVQLTWVNPTPATWTDFNQYNIWRNTGTGFVLIDSVQNNAISAYLDATANGNAGSISYYLQTKSGCSGQTDPSAIGGAANGNTLRTIYLVVSGGNTTTATLNWNPVSTPLLATSGVTYTIEKENPGGSGNWSVAGNTAANTWQENLVLCIDSINYRVSISDGAGCTSLSNVDGEIFVDHTVPVAPAPRCANVQPNGNVILNWIAPVDTGQRFANYSIYRSSSIGGPYTSIATITNYNTLTYTDLTANAQAGSLYYYMTTKTACGGEVSPGSDTLQTIKVDVFNNNGVAVLVWNPLHNPELATATLNYDVYKEYPTGIWNKIGTTIAPVYTWNDTINVCEAVINYRVQTGDQSGCISNSSTDGDLFRDITRPTVSALDTVSLDPFNPSQVSVSWLPSPSGDVVGYIIYHFNGASWDSIGSVIGINASYFLDNNPAAEFASQRYSIAAYDSCRNISNLGTLHNTLFVTAKLDICRSAIDLRWNPYLNMVNGVAQYNIYMSENGGPFTFLASVPGTSITYSHVTLTNGSVYCYYIQAEGNTSTRTASSNQACETANLLTLPTFSYLKKATVVDLRRVIVECYVDTANDPDVSKYKLQRAFDKNGPFTTVGAVTYTGDPIVVFNDFSARTDQYSYYYRVITVDSCSNDVLISNVGRTILLSGKPEFNLVNELKWNFYEEWLGNVSRYSLFRSVDGLWSPTPIATMNNGILDYNDDVAALYQYPNYSGKFCYRIEAYEGSGNTYGFMDTSVSNIFCLVQEPHLFIPSGFTPSGKNPVFKPEFIYIEAKNYFFVVFNRWGQRVYETRIPGEGWDGTYDGKIAPEGTYVYSVRIFGTNGQEIEKSGSVTLLR